MKTVFMKPWIFGALLLASYSLPGYAQIPATGMMGAMQGCPYQQSIGEEAESIQDDINERKQDQKDLEADIKEQKSLQREMKRKLERARGELERRGLQDVYLNKIIDHITEGRACSEYDGHIDVTQATIDEESSQSRMPASFPPPKKDTKRQPPTRKGPPDSGNSEPGVTKKVENSADSENVGKESSTKTSGSAPNDTDPYSRDDWARICDKTHKGRVHSGACDIPGTQVQKGAFSVTVCRDSLRTYQETKEKLDQIQNRLDALNARKDSLKIEIKTLTSDRKQAQRDYEKELREQSTEGGCIQCMLNGSGYYAQSRKPDWGGVVTNVGLGIASMYFGNDLQKSQTAMYARLGMMNPNPTYPSFGYGFPFMMNAVSAAMGGGGGGGFYGAVGGGIGAGGFGCAGGAYGNGSAGMVGGPFGYPASMYQTPYGGGMMTGYPGMMAGGAMNGMMNPMMGGAMGGLMNPYGGMMNPMMGGAMNGMMNPYGGMMNPMMAGGLNGMMNPMMGNMMTPYGAGGAMNGMMNPYGSMMNPMMGGSMNGMMNPMMGGSMNGMMNPMMNGMMDPSMMQAQMQMQQQQMQMQMQQQQMYMQMQQRASENYMNRQRIVQELNQQMMSLTMKLQQAQMGMYSGSMMDMNSQYGFGGSFNFNGGSMYQPGVPGVPSGTPYIPTNTSTGR